MNTVQTAGSKKEQISGEQIRVRSPERRKAKQEVGESVSKNVLLEMKLIHKRFAGVHALNDISLELHAGEVTMPSLGKTEPESRH